jgi:hypothetical protein
VRFEEGEHYSFVEKQKVSPHLVVTYFSLNVEEYSVRTLRTDNSLKSFPLRTWAGLRGPECGPTRQWFISTATRETDGRKFSEGFLKRPFLSEILLSLVFQNLPFREY